MKQKLINDINNYIAYLNNNGLYVTVHGRGISGLFENNVHRNPFCSLVKTDEDAWKKCVRCQQKVFKESSKEILFGMCHAGLEEYVFFVSEKTFISVSGYGINREKAAVRIKQLSREFFLNEKELLKVYDKTLKHQKEDEVKLHTIIKPLCYMLSLLQMVMPEELLCETKNAVVDNILNYIQFNYMQDITIRDIAESCACSESTVCHLFKQYMGESVKKYIADLRLNQAKMLLKNSELPISSVAQMCGFSNINYFPTAFKKYSGYTPTEYRESLTD